MKLMIASDLHGSAAWTRRLLREYHRIQPDRLVLLGDLLYHGPRNDLPEEYAPKTVIPMLNAIKDDIMAVRGNCEAEVDQMVLEFPVLADYAILWAGERMIFATHGHHHNKNAMPPLQPGDILLHGHTHIPAWEPVGENLYLNPGSVSIPKEGSERGYMTFDGKTFLWKNLSGQVYHTLSL